ncbi:class II aldolase/adducin family protein [Sphingomonas naphthae]|uniref:Class II aldolase/adducin family protein n=1 Tax=Sphingomonas naphthae TaxID=1813468 RepID=A0ABY7TN48_9SPHN|nr:class II aldolase/adducin family protein [Sphingomonas naphthae]WCT74355.1 class II aldolase/adducin family protein [Sphingomonas naphthae]
MSTPDPATVARREMLPGEWQVRVELAAAYRILALEGLDDGIWNHLSCAIPGTDHFLLKPHGLLFCEVTASNLIVVALDGALIRGEGMWEPTAFTIHSRVHAAFPDLPCVMHLHPPHATALACAEENRLLPLSQDCLRFIGRLGYFDEYGGLALAPEEGNRMVAALAGNTTLMMANHGVLTTGRTVAEALYDMHYIEVACAAQALAVQSAIGGRVRLVDPETAALTHAQINRNRLKDATMHLAAQMRLLDRAGSDYAR